MKGRIEGTEEMADSMALFLHFDCNCVRTLLVSAKESKNLVDQCSF